MPQRIKKTPIERAKELLNAKGFIPLGSGQSAIVFKGKSTNTVLKIFVPDRCYVDFLKFIAKHPNKHFPKVKKLVKFKAPALKGLYGIKLEPLKPLSLLEYNKDIGFHCFCLTVGMAYSSIFDLNASFNIAMKYYKNNEYITRAGEWEKENVELAKAIRLLSTRMNKNKCRNDLKASNIMKRGNDWVITDPYWTGK